MLMFVQKPLLSDVLVATENWMVTFPRIPWPAEFALCRQIHDRLLAAKGTTGAAGMSIEHQLR